VQIRTRRGKTLSDVPADGLESRLGAPSAAVHRADLQRFLLRELGEENVRLGAQCSAFEQDDGGVTAVFADGSEERGDVLIGADGLYSTVRGQVHRPQEPRYAGYTAWRAVVEPGRELLPWGAGFESWGRGARFGCAHIGGGRIYWFATTNAPEGKEDGPIGTPSEPGATLMRRFGGWHHPIPALISGTEETAIRRDDLYDREPLSGSWGTGCVTLLGDAAHPSTPNLGQGACQAIEDAVTLARCLREDDNVPFAVRRYEDLRREHTSWIIRRSRSLGRIGQLENPALCWVRDAVLKATPARVQLRQLEKVMLYEDPTSVG
ncbi:MAG: FAD-dependent monooxygenase, partial [Rubrobacter sp.]